MAVKKVVFAPLLYRCFTGPKTGNLQRYATNEAEAAETFYAMCFYAMCLGRALGVSKPRLPTRVGDTETTLFQPYFDRIKSRDFDTVERSPTNIRWHCVSSVLSLYRKLDFRHWRKQPDSQHERQVELL